MKKLLFTINLFLILTGAFAQNQTVTFQVNMSYQITQGKFDPATETVDVAGNFNGWGSTTNQLSDADGDSIYVADIGGFSVSQVLEFKFRLNNQWDGREEFPGVGNNRTYAVLDSGNVLLYWYNDEIPSGGSGDSLSAVFSTAYQEFYAGGVLAFENYSTGNNLTWEWTFEGGVPSTSSDEFPSVKYPVPGTWDVSLIVSNGTDADTLTQTNYITVNPRDADTTYSWNEEVFYEIFVRSFYDSDGDGIGDFNGLTQKLDYLNDGDPNTDDDLGITGIWLMPIHDSPSYHGYDVLDYRSVNPDYGTMADFQNFLNEAHQRGIKVIIDFVMNHSSSSHPWFLNSASGTGAPLRDWYRWSPNHPGYNGPWGQPVWHNHATGFYFGLFWSGMPDLNYENQAVKDTMFAISDFWVNDIGVDGFRLDAVKHIIEDGAQMENTPANFTFLEEYHAYYKQNNPETFTVGEAWTSTDQVIRYVSNDRLDLCFEFDLAGSMIQAVQNSQVEQLEGKILEVYNRYPHLRYGTFLTNHDMNRVFSVFAGDETRMKLAASVYLTLPGTPFLYYGEEIGMFGTKPDEFIRRPMQWTAGARAGFTSGTPWVGINASYVTYNVASETSDSTSLLSHYRRLIHLRNNEIALRLGTYLPGYTSSSEVLAFLRQYEDETVVVIVNTGSQSKNLAEISFPHSEITGGGYDLMDILRDQVDMTLNIDSTVVLENIQLNGGETKIFKLEKSTGIDDIPEESNLLIYPNPSNSNIHIALPASSRLKETTITVYDLHGRQWLKMNRQGLGTHFELEVKALPAGYYFLKIEDENGVYVGRFVKD